jgi:Xaa-Pro dipeptidase
LLSGFQYIKEMGNMAERIEIFSREEYLARINKVKEQIKARNLDLLLVHGPENVFYLAGHHSPGYYMYMCLMVPADGEPALLVRRGELGNAMTYSWMDDLIGYDDTDDPVEKTVQVIRDKGFRYDRIGVDFSSWFFTTKNYLKLANILKGSQIEDASGIVEKLRVVKSPSEIEYIRKACKSADVAMQMAVDAIRVGGNENDIASAIFKGLCESGSEYLGMEPFVASGPRSATMHSPWSGRVIKDGDTILLEIAGCKNRYHGALMRSVHVGKVPSRVKEWSKVCIESLNAAIDAIKPGVTSGQVDEACRGVIERAGLYEYFRKRTGYSIGIAFAPDWGEGHMMDLKKDDPRVLQPGMVFHMPPALRDFGNFGVGFSETVLVTDNGCEVLTSLPRELFTR